MLLGPMEGMTMSKTEIMMFYEKQLFSSLHLNILWLSLLYTWENSRNEYLQDNVAPIGEVGLEHLLVHHTPQQGITASKFVAATCMTVRICELVLLKLLKLI